MIAAIVIIAALLAADFLHVVWRARREWQHGGELSSTTAHLISSLYVLTVALLVLSLVARPWPLGLAVTVALTAGGLAIVGGAALAAPGLLSFSSAKQLWGVESGGLITGGIYRYSRNPQYTGLGIMLAGVAVLGRSGLAVAVAAAYWVAIRIWLTVEEAHLLRTFGAEYAAYRQRAPRFLSFRRGS